MHASGDKSTKMYRAKGKEQNRDNGAHANGTQTSHRTVTMKNTERPAKEARTKK